MVGFFTFALVLLNFGLKTVDIQAFPQDFFMQLDGIYRLRSGQHIYTDFSSPFGIALYAVPLMFVHSAGDLALSVNYASGLYLGVGLLLVLYLTWTRLSPVLGLALGIWIALALAARMDAGTGPMAVTLAENYNRNCAVALALALLICRAPRFSSLTIAITDGLIYALLAAFLFYTKITYGLVALAFVPVVMYPHPRRLVTFAGFAVAFGLLVLAVEYGYGTRFQWFQAAQTAAAAGGVLKPGPILEVVFQNFAELLICILVPAWFLWQERRFTPWAVIFFFMVASAAVVLARLGSSHLFLFLPAVMFFVAAPPALSWSEGRPAAAGDPRQERLRYAFTAITLTVLSLESAPPFVNVLFSAYQSLAQPPMVAGDDVLERIVFQSQNNDDMIKVISAGQVTALDAFGIARASRPMQRWDSLTMSEFRDYLTDGLRAAREVCKRGDRILTADVSNPFPLLLGWPVGGGMVVLQPGLTVSDKVYPSPDIMFRNIGCVLVPKLPLQRAARDFILDKYGAYLTKNFSTAGETELWKVLR